MKKIIILTLSLFATLFVYAHGGGNMIHSNIKASMTEDDKLAVLMVHFGTTHADTRAVTIDALNTLAAEAFSDTEIREAYTSRVVIRRLGQQDIVKLNPAEALEQLHADGYTHLLIQSSGVIDGVEMESLRRNVWDAAPMFKDIRLGDPLLFEPQDYETVIDALTEGTEKEKAYVLVGHGTYDASTAQYAMLDYLFKAKGHANFFVGTLEGYPGQEEVMNQLAASGLKEVVLVPFLFVAGDHAKNDIAGDWKEAFENAGYTVDVRLQGLGENATIRNLYIRHLRYLVGHKKLDILERKAGFQSGEVDYDHEKGEYHHH
jgi:Cobalamin biosynthesis protein CbiK, Co2+ chelatase